MSYKIPFYTLVFGLFVLAVLLIIQRRVLDRQYEAIDWLMQRPAIVQMPCGTVI